MRPTPLPQAAAMSVEHYENFPVASLLCPPAQRPAIQAIYHFARTADDIADEGDATPAQRLADLRAYGAALQAAARGDAIDGRWAAVFRPLQRQIRERALPVPLLQDLLDAFEQDLRQHRYADRAAVLDYCRRSANPVGRLLLHLYGIADATSLWQSDQICSALQLANFWQDLSIDTQRGRLYVPLADCAQAGVDPAELLARRDSPAIRRLVAEMVRWTREMMLAGSPLVHTLPGRAGWELRFVVQGGLRILERIERLQYRSLATRPTIGWTDGPALLWRALLMRRGHPASLQNARP